MGFRAVAMVIRPLRTGMSACFIGHDDGWYEIRPFAEIALHEIVQDHNERVRIRM
jgi:hypothetical protein